MRKQERKLDQRQLGEICGVSRVQVSRWEHGLDLPSARALLKIAELLPEAERQWWRDQAAQQAGADAVELLSAGVSPGATRSIPLIHHSTVGSLGPLLPADVEQTLVFPAGWFPEGGTIRAARLDIPISPHMQGGCIVLIDISRRDPDRLVGCTVAVQGTEGIDLCVLRQDHSTYLLDPLRQGPKSSVRLLRHHGENSILGQVLKGIADFAITRVPKRPQAKKPGRRARQS